MDAAIPTTPQLLPCINVIRGHPCPEELAAVTAVLLSRSVALSTHAVGCSRSTAEWRRLERRSGFCPPHSWQRGSDPA
ncbi:acyl-CoA carboxylase subunit epsilon [Streptomyces sp. NBC_00690]|uniref:acyl-CoA carboxylase subunit epsilon n=2 Tax=unclassified Streptomyces TaxID=2593676 RepID=UPI002E2E70A1|nr:acyl-CoA carboxylase subunit epsilon [Streptomyces sp. NBC_00690]